MKAQELAMLGRAEFKATTPRLHVDGYLVDADVDVVGDHVRVTGRVFADRKMRFNDGQRISTSPLVVVAVIPKTMSPFEYNFECDIHTRNSIYRIISWRK